MSRIRIALAQFDFTVGSITPNAERILDISCAARDRLDAHLVVFPELALCGYPPEDLLLRPSFLAACQDEAEGLAQAISGIDAVVGTPWADDRGVHNMALWVRNGEIHQRYAKQNLPNYQVFDEQRYFVAGSEPCVVECQGVRCALLICEDIWREAPGRAAVAAGAQLLIVTNASPYVSDKRSEREALLRRRAHELAVPLIYVNLVGGQDDLVFDGGSMAVDAKGNVHGPALAFEEMLVCVEFDSETGALSSDFGEVPAAEDELALIYAALVCGTRDYVDKNGFLGVLLGLSGGIDSALTLAIAVDALGADRVKAFMLPSRYTSELSLREAKAQAELLGVELATLSIEGAVEACGTSLSTLLGGDVDGITAENLQSRMRAVMLMAMSNHGGGMLLTTGNKSELAVGYATLYGDMCGGYAPLKDVYKSDCYRLSEWRNHISPAIPQAVIDRPPSAELAEGQLDQDSLPPYPQLDAILDGLIERELSPEALIAEGHDRDTVARVWSLVLRNEHKRRQGAPGPRVTRRAFGRDRRYPITSGWR